MKSIFFFYEIIVEKIGTETHPESIGAFWMKCMPELRVEFLSSREVVENICKPIVFIYVEIRIKWNFEKPLRSKGIFEKKRWLILDFEFDSIGSVRIFDEA